MPARVRDLGERRNDVEPRERPRGGEQRGRVLRDAAADVLEQLVLEPPPALLGAEHLGLVVLAARA